MTHGVGVVALSPSPRRHPWSSATPGAACRRLGAARGCAEAGAVLGGCWGGVRMVLGCTGVVVGWCWHSAGGLLKWCPDGSGVVPVRCWGGAVMMPDGAGMVPLPLPCAECAPHSPAAWSVWPCSLPTAPCPDGTAQPSDRAGPAGHHSAAPEPCPRCVPMERMSWLSKLTPRGVGQRAARSASLQSPVTADPETCLMVFKNHWAQVSRCRAVGAGRPSGGC